MDPLIQGYESVLGACILLWTIEVDSFVWLLFSVEMSHNDQNHPGNLPWLAHDLLALWVLPVVAFFGTR